MSWVEKKIKLVSGERGDIRHSRVVFEWHSATIRKFTIDIFFVHLSHHVFCTSSYNFENTW